ncbi:2-C-methyl-D-erythritol 2,4-cyclodiphosphate synthase [Arcanobacterium hippocoleae]|uniref:2-C-methyl-D-erythritol 2,4-cyclodiphosphate synthase n=1 Tax=Arcanobacterium hippocoleae TaxID=149017 RepID=A0ABU1T1V6_9ACTO|nr:2-C-methyl-D-erythritol 2,4-cyclodiphosphate synthase [Arcanobacterium hippocoleae]MDR6939353.1 2-C-methyl-D-erythritol 2,4-cyclodiphosphate synthase [Arcanobacterium hippocoleae]
MEIKDLRTATAIDLHAFSTDPQRTLWLACLPWPGEQALEGHSDADVAAHAAADALLMASGVGELGSVFGTDRPEWAGASGQILLSEAVRRTTEAGWQIANISVQIIGQKPRFAARKAAAETLMSTIVGAPVSVSATSTDKLGTVGRKEGIAAIATALLWR